MNFHGTPHGHQPNLYQGHQQYQSSRIPSSNSSRKSTNIDGEATDKSQETPTSGNTSAFRQRFSPQRLDAINLNFNEQSDDAVADDDDDDADDDALQYKKTLYGEDECVHLAKCWVDISIYSIVGNEQKSEQMWERITKAYNKGKPKDTPPRTNSSLKTLFYTMSKESKRWSSCYYKIAQMWQSGANEDDIIKKAQQEYKQRHGTQGFKYIKVWRMLDECPKFAQQDGEVRASKKGKSSSNSAFTTASKDDEDEEPLRTRPIGNKAAKRNAAKGKEKSSGQVKEIVDAINARAEATMMMAKAMNEKQKAKEYKILMCDTSKMTETQLRLHNRYCAEIQQKWEAEL